MEEGTPSTLPKTPDKAAAKLRAPPAKTAWAPNPTPNPNQSAIPPAMPPSSLVSNVTPNEVASNTLPVPNPISPGIGLSMLSPTIFSPGPAFNTSSPTLMGLSSKLASASHFSLEPDIFQDLQQVGDDLMVLHTLSPLCDAPCDRFRPSQMQTPGRAKPQVALTPTRFTSTYTLESPMMISFGGTPQHGTPTWALKESPSKYSRLTSPLRNRESPNGKGAKDPIADWTLSPLDTCRFLVSPGLGSDAMFNMSPAPGRGRRRITPLKRKLEDESGEPSSSGNHLLLPAADTPDVPNAAFGTDTTTKREPLQREREQATMWRSLPTIVQMRLEASPCLADLALGTAKLRDFKGIKDGACDKEGVLALAEVLFGGRERLETMALSDSRGESMTGDMKCRVLEWEGLPLRSEKESAAHKYSMLLERLKAHAMRGAIYRLLGVSAGVTSDMCLATFLTSPYKVTFDALRESPQFQ